MLYVRTPLKGSEFKVCDKITDEVVAIFFTQPDAIDFVKWKEKSLDLPTTKRKTLNVIETCESEITTMWGNPPLLRHKLFVRCNAKGEIDWEIAPVYKESELLRRGSYNILKRKTK